MLVAGALVDSFGNGLFLAASTLYFVGVLRFPAAQVATTLSVAAIFGLLSPLPLGHVADRWGVVRTYVALMCLRGAGFAAYALIHGFAGYAVLTCALLAAERACSPLLQVIVSGVAGQEERTRTLASIRAVRNAGLTGGLLVAGLVLGLHVTAAFRAVFLVDAVSFLVIAWMALWAVRASDGIPTAPAADVRSGAAPYRDPRFMVFTVSNGVLSLFDSLIVVLLPIWVVQRTELPHAWLSSCSPSTPSSRSCSRRGCTASRRASTAPCGCCGPRRCRWWSAAGCSPSPSGCRCGSAWCARSARWWR
ncbi:MFS transporter [Kitasatospora aburaviensis]